MASAYPLADRFAGQLAEFEAPEAVVRQRLALAARTAEAIAGSERIAAALVVGSTALRRCSPRADLDLVLICPRPDPEPRFEARTVEGIRIELERITPDEALTATADNGWTWELRAGARLGCGLSVYDPDGAAARLQARAAAQRPWADQTEATLRGIYLQLAALGAGDGLTIDDPEALRGCLDNLALLALLATPRRYQKPKWVLADLVHADERTLLEATLAAYGIAGSAEAAKTSIRRARALLDAALSILGAPDHATLLAMGYAPAFAGASYVSRTLADAEDLAESGRATEADYVARFTARLTGALVCQPQADTDLAAALNLRDPVLADLYARVFKDAAPLSRALLDTVLASADARLAELESGMAAGTPAFA